MESDLIRDPLWQFAGALLSAVAIVVTVWIAWSQRRNKRLTYRMRTSQLVSVDAQIHDRIKITYEEQPIVDVRLAELSFKSAGNIPIVPSDFVKPLQCDFGASSRVLTAEITATEPEDLGAVIRWHGDGTDITDTARVEVEPLLLNPGDGVSIRCLVTDSTGFDVVGRISGVKTIEREQVQRNWRPFLIGMLAGLLPNIIAYWVGNTLRTEWLPTLVSGLMLAFSAGWLARGRVRARRAA